MALQTVKNNLREIRRANGVDRSEQLIWGDTAFELPENTTLKFTPLRWEIFKMRMQGMSRIQISRHFENVSHDAVKYHLQKMRLDNHCETMAQLILKVVQEIQSFSNDANRKTG